MDSRAAQFVVTSLACFASGFGIGGCGGDGGECTNPTAPCAKVVQLALSEANLTLEPQDQLTVVASPKDKDGRTRERAVTWVSWNPSVASVSSSQGTSVVVNGLSPGTTTIAATSEGITAQVNVVVRQVVARVDVSPATTSLGIGATRTMSAAAIDKHGATVPGATVSWSSSAPTVASVSATGIVAGIGLGAATISAASEGKSGTAQVTVTQPMVATVTVLPMSVVLGTGHVRQFEAAAQSVSGTIVTNVSWQWVSTNPLVASTSSSGLVTASSPGTTTIRATASQSGSSSVTTGAVASVVSVLVNGIVTLMPVILDNAVQWYMVVVPAGRPSFTVNIAPGPGATGDADLYLFTPQTALPTGFGASGNTSVPFLCRPFLIGSSETCTVASPAAGQYLVAVHSYPGDGTTSNVTVRFSHP